MDRTLRLLAPDRKRHREALCDIIPKVFSSPSNGYFRGRDFCRKYYLAGHYDWATSRIGMMGDELVTHFGVWDYQMRIGTARVRVGGIGAVLTHGDYRKQGLMDQTARAAVTSMREQGYDFSLLFGIDNFYHRFGYVRAWAETFYFAKIADLPQDTTPAPLRKFTSAGRPELQELYNRYYAMTTGTAVRPTYTRMFCDIMQPDEGYYWQDPAGTLAGYVVVRQQQRQLICTEYAGDARQALRVLAALGRKRHLDKVKFDTLPYTSELARLLRRGSCRIETHAQRCGGAMICLVNLRTTLEKLRGELSARLQASPLASWQGLLCLRAADETVGLSIADGLVSITDAAESPHCLQGGHALAQLLIGTETPEEVMAANGMQVDGDAEALARVLFPAQYPQLCQSDRF